MNKMNKKGFTLIEMLVVIAIIAVLVSIIVPVVGNSTAKAAAATNAANLRSYAASVAVVVLAPGDAKVEATEGNESKITSGTNVIAPNAPTAKKVGSIWTGTNTAKCYLKNGTVIATFGSSCPSGTPSTDEAAAGTLEYFAYIAENGVAKSGQ